MTIEMTIAPASADGESFEIATRDVTGISGDDPSRFLQEAEGGQYSRLLLLKRDSDGFVSQSDLEPLTSFPSGVYILINTKATSNNRWSVFAGMSGIDQPTLIDYLGTRDVDERTIFAHCVGGPSNCLLMQSEQPPTNMGNWDLAIVIPTKAKEETIELFYKLCKMLDEFKEFFPRHQRPLGELARVNKISPDSSRALLMSSTANLVSDGGEYLIQLFHSLLGAIGPGLLIETVKSLLWKRPGKKDFFSSIFVDKSFNISPKNKKGDISISIGNTTKNYYINVHISHDTEDQNRPGDFDK